MIGRTGRRRGEQTVFVARNDTLGGNERQRVLIRVKGVCNLLTRRGTSDPIRGL